MRCESKPAGIAAQVLGHWERTERHRAGDHARRIDVQAQRLIVRRRPVDRKHQSAVARPGVRVDLHQLRATRGSGIGGYQLNVSDPALSLQAPTAPGASGPGPATADPAAISPPMKACRRDGSKDRRRGSSRLTDAAVSPASATCEPPSSARCAATSGCAKDDQKSEEKTQHDQRSGGSVRHSNNTRAAAVALRPTPEHAQVCVLARWKERCAVVRRGAR